jgi:hypothetical protein
MRLSRLGAVGRLLRNPPGDVPVTAIACGAKERGLRGKRAAEDVGIREPHPEMQ